VTEQGVRKKKTPGQQGKENSGFVKKRGSWTVVFGFSDKGFVLPENGVVRGQRKGGVGGRGGGNGRKIISRGRYVLSDLTYNTRLPHWENKRLTIGCIFQTAGKQ